MTAHLKGGGIVLKRRSAFGSLAHQLKEGDAPLGDPMLRLAQPSVPRVFTMEVTKEQMCVCNNITGKVSLKEACINDLILKRGDNLGTQP